MQIKKGFKLKLSETLYFIGGNYWVRTSDPLLVRHNIRVFFTICFIIDFSCKYTIYKDFNKSMFVLLFVCYSFFYSFFVQILCKLLFL